MRIDEFNKIKNYIREKISRGIDVTTVAYNMSNIINFLHTCYESRLLKYDQYVLLVHFTVCYGNRIIDDLYMKRKCFIKGEEKMKRETGKFKSIAFGEYAAKWRARCKISRRDMAKITDLDYTSIYKFETGRIKSLYILSAYIHCGFDPVYELTRPENRSEEDEN